MLADQLGDVRTARWLRISWLRVSFVQVVVAAVVVLMVAAIPVPLQRHQIDWINLALLASIGAIALNLLMGIAGQVSIGNAAFLGIGAAVTAAMTNSAPSIPAWIVVFAATATAAAVGAVVGIPALRLRGIYLAIATLALHYIVSFAVGLYQASAVGPLGFFIPTFSIGSVDLRDPRAWYYALAVVVAFLFYAMNTLVHHSRYGRAWFLLRDRPIAAQAMGIDIARYKVLAFVVASALIGLEGALFAYYIGLVEAGMFTFVVAIQYIAMIVIGGWGSIPGAVLGAFFVTLVPFALSTLSGLLTGDSGLFAGRMYDIQTAAYGALIVAFLIFQPRGLVAILTGGTRAVSGIVRARTGGRTTARVSHLDAAAVVVAPTRVALARGGADDQRPPVLDVQGLSVTYMGGIAGVQDVSLRVDGGVTVVLGPNGAGKTTTLRAITGFLPSEHAHISGGRVYYDGRDITRLSPAEVVARGVALVPERDKVFRTLTVAENLHLAALRGRRRDHNDGRRVGLDLADELFPALRGLRDRKAGYLSGGERQMLAIARALALQPRLLLVDEISLGVAPVIVAALMEALRRINMEHGVAILMAEQNASAALEIADSAYVLDTGITVMHGSASEVAHDPKVKSAFLGFEA